MKHCTLFDFLRFLSTYFLSYLHRNKSCCIEIYKLSFLYQWYVDSKYILPETSKIFPCITSYFCLNDFGIVMKSKARLKLALYAPPEIKILN